MTLNKRTIKVIVESKCTEKYRAFQFTGYFRYNCKLYHFENILVRVTLFANFQNLFIFLIDTFITKYNKISTFFTLWVELVVQCIYIQLPCSINTIKHRYCDPILISRITYSITLLMIKITIRNVDDNWFLSAYDYNYIRNYCEFSY